VSDGAVIGAGVADGVDVGRGAAGWQEEARRQKAESRTERSVRRMGMFTS
jgi:hypothetical protein